MARRIRTEEMQDIARDPIVAAYLREVDQMPEMTREGEIYLMKQIESGKKAVRDAVLSSSVGTQEVLRLWRNVKGA